MEKYVNKHFTATKCLVLMSVRVWGRAGAGGGGVQEVGKPEGEG